MPWAAFPALSIGCKEQTSCLIGMTLSHTFAILTSRRPDLARWEAEARRLEPVTPAVLVEISDLHTDPCKHRLHCAAVAARYKGYYVTSPKGLQVVTIVRGLSTYPLDRTALQLRSADMVAAVLQGDPHGHYKAAQPSLDTVLELTPMP